MRFQSPLIAVTDLERSKRFYHDVLGLDVVLDFGANVTLTGGLNLQTLESWADFLGKEPADVAFGGNNGELYFDETEFDGFIARLYERDDIVYVHRAVEHAWGQRAVRFYDPDRHIIEVGENIESVVRRFVDGGMSVEQTALRMDVPPEYVRSCL